VSTTLLDTRDMWDLGAPRQPQLARRRRGAGGAPRSARARQADARPARAADAPGGRSSHTPVLASELLALLDPQPGQLAVDCTFGDGGHARLLVEQLGSSGTLVAIDRDPLAEQRFAELAAEAACSLRFIRSSYAEALALLASEGARADIVYFDLGMSSMQVDTRERGFSYSYEAPLDMRMDPSQELSARQIVAEWDERRLARALRDFGEERHAGAIARAIVRRRERAAIETTLELVDTISSAIPTPARFAPSAPSRHCGSPSTTSSSSSTVRSRSRGICCARAACSRASPFTRSRTAASSASSASAHKAASVRRTCRCARAGASPRRSC